MGQDGDDARRAEERREASERHDRILARPFKGDRPAYFPEADGAMRGGFGAPAPEVAARFELTGFERLRIGVAIREHVARMVDYHEHNPSVALLRKFEADSIGVCVKLIENIIAEEVEQCTS
jgi:hypothetical protein